jgi:hypothetical protein
MRDVFDYRLFRYDVVLPRSCQYRFNDAPLSTYPVKYMMYLNFGDLVAEAAITEATMRVSHGQTRVMGAMMLVICVKFRR